MTLQEALTKCGWTDELIAHFTRSGWNAIENKVVYQKKPILIDSATLIVRGDSHKDTTALIFHSDAKVSCCK